jgi:Short C-terminal domain
MASGEATEHTEDTASGGQAGTAGTTTAPTAEHRHRGRMIAVNTLIGITTLLLVVGVFAVFANRLLFSPDNWSNTSTQLLQNPQIRSTTANYIVDQIYANVNVADLIKSGLPPQLQALAAPAAGALRNAAVQGTELALSRPRVQNLWREANRAADKTFITVVEGGKGPIGVNQGVVTLNLGSIVDNIASRLGLPSNLSAKLPADIATLTVLKSDQIKVVQNAGNAIKSLALWLTILVPLLYILALVLAPAGRRRRTLMVIGSAAILGGVLVILGRNLLQSQIPNSITNDASLRPTVAATIGIATEILGSVAAGIVVIGAVLVVAGWFAGPARIASSARQAIAPFLRDHAAETYAITLTIMVLIFIWDPIHATGTPAGILVFLVLALVGTYILRRQTMEEFPDAEHGATMAKLRGGVENLRNRRGQSKATGADTGSMPEQLRQLAELRDHGEITGDEYQAAKDKLLHSP